MTQKTNKLWGYRHGVISNMHLWTCLVHQVVTSEGAAEKNSDNMKCTVEGVGGKKNSVFATYQTVSKNVQTDEWLVNFINISHNHSAETTAVTTLTEEVTLNCMQSHFTQKVLLELFNHQQETPKHVCEKYPWKSKSHKLSLYSDHRKSTRCSHLTCYSYICQS